jgi:hypothetical protein
MRSIDAMNKSALIFAALLMLLPALCFADTPPAIQDAYTNMDQLLAQRDAEGILKMFTWNATFFDGNGVALTRAQVANSIRREIRGTQSIASTTTVQNATQAPDGVTTTIQQKISSTNISPKTGILNTIYTVITERDHWVQIGSAWKINRSRIVSSYVEKNGTVVH